MDACSGRELANVTSGSGGARTAVVDSNADRVVAVTSDGGVGIFNLQGARLIGPDRVDRPKVNLALGDKSGDYLILSTMGGGVEIWRQAWWDGPWGRLALPETWAALLLLSIAAISFVLDLQAGKRT